VDYDEAIFGPPDNLATAVKTDALRPIVAGLSDNVARIYALWQASPYLISIGTAIQQATYFALHQITGSPIPKPEYQRDPVLMAAVSQAATFRLVQIDRKFASAQGNREALAAGLTNLNLMLSGGPNTLLSKGIGAVLESMLLSAWTTFETLAADLWETALNEHPQELALLRGKLPRDAPKAKKPLAALPPREAPETAESKMIKLDYLQRHGYNLSRLMGTVLREKFNFQILESIREAYAQAFDERHAAVRAAVFHPSLTALAATRNVLVHRAGVVDQEFLDDMKRTGEFAGLFTAAKLKVRLEVGGKAVGQLLRPAVAQMGALIAAVDAFLAGGQSKSGD
jgi:hypothetical protein